MSAIFKLGKFNLDLSKPQIMGVLNITQDSFSDSGKYIHPLQAISRAEQMIDEGASIIDIGGESTRPGAKPVPTDLELERILPLVEHVVKLNIPVSIDTSKPEVMKAAVELGASLINDVCALQNQGALEMASKLDASICLMHMQGSPQTMQTRPQYDDVVGDILNFFQSRIDHCEAVGIEKNKIILDPGFGFGKTLDHNFSMLHRFKEFQILGLPLLAGLSRKSMIGEIINKPAEQRVAASVALAIIAWQNGASFIRVHDVAETQDAFSMLNKLALFESNN